MTLDVQPEIPEINLSLSLAEMRVFAEEPKIEDYLVLGKINIMISLEDLLLIDIDADEKLSFSGSIKVLKIFFNTVNLFLKEIDFKTLTIQPGANYPYVSKNSLRLNIKKDLKTLRRPVAA